jgi:hypothetical protein
MAEILESPVRRNFPTTTPWHTPGPSAPPHPNWDGTNLALGVVVLVVAVILVRRLQTAKKGNPVKKPVLADNRRPQSQETATVGQPASISRKENSSVTPEVRQKLRVWAAQNFGGPDARTDSVTAAAITALAKGQDKASIVAAARQADAQWSNANPQAKSDQPGRVETGLEDQWRHWVEQRFGGPEGRTLAAFAAAMRAIQLRQDQAHVVAAAKAAAEAWRPSQEQPASNSPLIATRQPPELGEAPPGVVRGQVGGLVKRSVPVSIGRSRIIEIMWSFSLYRRGVGPNGRPLSPIPVQMQGTRIDGELEDGDLVEFDGTVIPATIMQLKSLRNLSKKSEIGVVHVPAMLLVLKSGSSYVIGWLTGVAILAILGGLPTPGPGELSKSPYPWMVPALVAWTALAYLSATFFRRWLGWLLPSLFVIAILVVLLVVLSALGHFFHIPLKF